MRRLAFLVLTLFFALPAMAADVEVKDLSNVPTCLNGAPPNDHINRTIAAASVGDVLILPVCDQIITKTITLSKAVTLQGAGIGSTTLRDGVTPYPSTAMIDITCSAASTGVRRVTGITLRNHDKTAEDDTGRIRINCSTAATSSIRLDHNRLYKLKGAAINVANAIGVIDHNDIVPDRRGINAEQASWMGAGSWGDKSWSEPVVWGSDDFLFIEANTFTRNACTDGFRGTRVVFRFNTFVGCHITVHGTESSGRRRGSRAIEAYKNYHDSSSANTADQIMVNLRSGSALVWRNTAVGLKAPKDAVKMDQDRTIVKYPPYGWADGTSPFDSPYPAAVEAVCSVPPCTATTVGTKTVTVAGEMWTPGQWIGYSIRKLTANCIAGTEGVGTACSSMVTANTLNRLTFSGTGQFNQTLAFNVGMTFELRLLTKVLDGIGMGRGSYIEGGSLSVAPSVPAGWNDQEPFPVYAWSNTNDGVANHAVPNFACRGASCAENVHFYNHAASFDGTVGVGVGTKAQLDAITTCTVGVRFWVTDEGEWFTAGSWASDTVPGADGRLYGCTTTDTWTVVYTPYTYPHPDTTPPQTGPLLTDITPTGGEVGTVVAIAITGVNLSGTVIDCSASGTLVTIADEMDTSDTEITANVTIDAMAATGVRTITCTRDAVASNTFPFEVQGAAEPVLVSILPVYAYLQSVSIPIAGVGANLNTGSPVLTVSPAQGVSVTNLNVSSATAFTATLVISLSTPPGIYNLTIATIGGSSNAVVFEIRDFGNGQRGVILLGRGR